MYLHKRTQTRAAARVPLSKKSAEISVKTLNPVLSSRHFRKKTLTDASSFFKGEVVVGMGGDVLKYSIKACHPRVGGDPMLVHKPCVQIAPPKLQKYAHGILKSNGPPPTRG